jgi:hypothetical protein
MGRLSYPPGKQPRVRSATKPTTVLPESALPCGWISSTRPVAKSCVNRGLGRPDRSNSARRPIAEHARQAQRIVGHHRRHHRPASSSPPNSASASRWTPTSNPSHRDAGRTMPWLPCRTEAPPKLAKSASPVASTNASTVSSCTPAWSTTCRKAIRPLSRCAAMI